MEVVPALRPAARKDESRLVLTKRVGAVLLLVERIRPAWKDDSEAERLQGYEMMLQVEVVQERVQEQLQGSRFGTEPIG